MHKTLSHLYSWDSITLPKELGVGGWGWRILDLEIFGNALIRKSLWRCLHSDGIWHNIIKNKYIGCESLEDLDSLNWNDGPKRSCIWNGFGMVWPKIRENLRWYFGNGAKILTGCRKLRGLENSVPLNDDIIQMLNQKGVFYLQQSILDLDFGVPRWKDASQMGLDSRWDAKWNRYINLLTSLGICTSVEGDRITWCGSKKMDGLSVRGIYSSLILKKQWLHSDRWFKKIWRINVQIKLIIFMWLVWRNKNLTWNNLQKRG